MASNKTTIIDNVRAKVPGVLDGMITLELGNAINEFLDVTNAWQEDVPFVTVEDQVEYPISATEGDINRFLGVTRDGSPASASFAMPDILTLPHALTAGHEMVAKFALTPPSTDALNVPDWMFLKFRIALIDGTLGRLMSQIAKPYANERMAIYHLRRFRNQTAQARSEVLRQFNYAGQAWSFPKGFR